MGAARLFGKAGELVKAGFNEEQIKNVKRILTDGAELSDVKSNISALREALADYNSLYDKRLMSDSTLDTLSSWKNVSGFEEIGDIVKKVDIRNESRASRAAELVSQEPSVSIHDIEPPLTSAEYKEKMRQEAQASAPSTASSNPVEEVTSEPAIKPEPEPVPEPVQEPEPQVQPEPTVQEPVAEPKTEPEPTVQEKAQEMAEEVQGKAEQTAAPETKTASPAEAPSASTSTNIKAGENPGFIKQTAKEVGNIVTKPVMAVGKVVQAGANLAVESGAAQAAAGGIATAGYSAGKGIWGLAGKLADWFVRYEPAKVVKDVDKYGKTITKMEGGGIRVNKKGIAFLGAIGATGNAMSATDDYMQEKMGTAAPERYTQTPNMQPPSYAMNGGATGDLVFALNAQRRGGYI